MHSTRPCPKVLSQGAELWEGAHQVFNWVLQRCQRFLYPDILWTSSWSHRWVLAHYSELACDYNFKLLAHVLHWPRITLQSQLTTNHACLFL